MTTVFRAPAQRDPLGASLIAIIRGAYDDNPRGKQVTIGPSEIGDPCARRLAFKMLATTGANTSHDPLPSIIGTATHAWLATAFRAANAGLAVPRWIVEQTVYPDDAHPGSADLYDATYGVVIDWKVLGPTSMKRYKAEGPSTRYITQGQLYGLGFERMGLAVNTIALAMLPRGGMLSGLHTWSAPYDRSIALAALKRIGDIACVAYDLDVVEHPERWSLIPASPSHECSYCPYMRPGAAVSATGCPGQLAS
jgi:hypothetical protein